MNRVTIEVRQLHFAYAAKPVLSDVNLSIEAGELFAVLGPSGSGRNRCCACSPVLSGRRRGR